MDAYERFRHDPLFHARVTQVCQLLPLGLEQVAEVLHANDRVMMGDTVPPAWLRPQVRHPLLQQAKKATTGS